MNEAQIETLIANIIRERTSITLSTNNWGNGIIEISVHLCLDGSAISSETVTIDCCKD